MGSECKTGILIVRSASPGTISYAKEKGLVVSLYMIVVVSLRAVLVEDFPT
jgi:hypothetical protein